MPPPEGQFPEGQATRSLSTVTSNLFLWGNNVFLKAKNLACQLTVLEVLASQGVGRYFFEL